MIGIAAVVISCVLANHMGLVSEIEKILRIKIPIVNCVKCFTFWSTLAFMLIHTYNTIAAVAISFLLSYSAIWLELFFGIIDKCYESIYEKVYKSSASTESSDNSDSENSEGSLP